jgi:hypothetical protein
MLRQLFFIILGWGPVAATGQVPKLTACFDTSTVQIGDAIRLRLTLSGTADAPDTVDLRALYRVVPDTQILARTGWVVGAKNNEWTNDLMLISYDSVRIGPLTAVRAVLQSGDSVRVTRSDCYDSVLVVPPLVPVDARDMADIKDIRREPRWWSDYAWILWTLGGIVVMIVLLRWLYQIFQRREKAPVERALYADPRTVALRKLEALERDRLWEHGPVKTYYAALTDILREYWSATNTTSLLDKTNPELWSQVAHRYDSDSYLNTELPFMLTWADLVKFAKGEPLPAFHQEALSLARRAVESG